MMPIVWSLSLLWFNHTRTAPPPAVPAAPLVPMLTQVTLVVSGPPDLSESVTRAMVREAAAIWRPLAVDVMEGDDESDVRTALHVIVEDREGTARPAPLGWVLFAGPGTPQPIIHVSRSAVTRFLDTSASWRQLPEVRRHTMMARVLGRVLAHELGHYLLRSSRHTAHGLMRATWTVDVMAAAEPVGFDLTLNDVGELQERTATLLTRERPGPRPDPPRRTDRPDCRCG